ADGDTVWRYEYDGFGRRVERGKTGYVLHFLWDGSSLFAVYAGATALKATYAYFPGGALPHSLRADAETYYLATDDLGSVLGLFGASGVANDYRYDPWGSAQHGSTTVSNWLRWAGQMLDWHEGLYAMGARSYDPELGRFISEDPLGLSAGINPYAYVGNSPTNGADPSGLRCYFVWTSFPWCDDAKELQVIIQGNGGLGGGYGGLSGTSLAAASDGDTGGPNSGFTAIGAPGSGGFLSTVGHFFSTHILTKKCGDAAGAFAFSFGLDVAALATGGGAELIRGAELGANALAAGAGDVAGNLARGWSLADALAGPAALGKAAVAPKVSGALGAGASILAHDPQVAASTAARFVQGAAQGHSLLGTGLRAIPFVGTGVRAWDAIKACIL
ncbi:MAG: RHS repeat-associated core domain-containing protein, partial [Candidatus Palauibacterales bacterium]|nr:RHS repeat-associated core domain-containing protein [Candidatus Palauibacterales bacterium]